MISCFTEYLFNKGVWGLNEKHTKQCPSTYGRDFVLMDDSARPHRARIVDQFLAAEAITRMDPWPACSPDMNPIEHC